MRRRYYMYGRPPVFNSLFKNSHKPQNEVRSMYSLEGMQYFFKFFHIDTPYVPLLLTLYPNKDKIPLAASLSYGRNPYHDYYKNFFNYMLQYKYAYMKKSESRGDYFYAVGPGLMYHIPSRESHMLNPLAITTIPSPIIEDGETLADLVDNKKPYIEVMFNNDIRSVNSTAWKYIRKHYIPLLQREEISFSFKPGRKIMDLTTVDYQQPKFKSFAEMNAFNQRVNESVSLRNALPAS